MTNADHEFGSVSTDLKLSMVEGYLSAFTVALRNFFPKLWYIDAFAGSGVRTVKHEGMRAGLLDAIPEVIERRRGSARIALDVAPGFDHLVFIDLKKRHCRALQELADGYPGRSVSVVRQEANSAILETITDQNWASKRAVMFLDPYGMHVDWATLEAVSKTKAIDVWYLVSLEGLYRQAPLDRDKLTDHKRAAITRLLGTTTWEDEWYADAPTEDGMLDFGASADAGSSMKNNRRTARLPEIEAYVQGRLETIFPAVLKPRRLNNKGGAPAFLLFFAMANPDPGAKRLATKIAGYILKTGNSSQVRAL